MKKWLVKILQDVFPERCLVCKKEGRLICVSCLASIPQLSLYNCLPEIISLYSYQNKIIHDALWRLKYHNRRLVGYAFGEEMFWRVKDRLNIFEKIILLPIPQNSQKIKKRNYNQTDILAQGFKNQAQVLDFDVKIIDDLILKIKKTERQAMIKNKEKRLRNMREVYTCNQKYKHLDKNTQIIIIDDITTTGATLANAKVALSRAGFQNILLVSVAH